MVHILNSAVMPQPGFYQLDAISQEDFVAEIRDAAKRCEIKHYIGYQSTLTYLNHLTGLDFGDTNRDKTTFENGDIFLVIRLKHRVDSAEKRMDNPHINDFEYFSGSYTNDVEDGVFACGAENIFGSAVYEDN